MKRLIPAILVVLVVLFSFSITTFATKDDPILNISTVSDGTISDTLSESAVATVYGAENYEGTGKCITIGKYNKQALIDAGVIKDSNPKIFIESLKLNTTNPVVIYLFNSAHFEGHYVEITADSPTIDLKQKIQSIIVMYDKGWIPTPTPEVTPTPVITPTPEVVIPTPTPEIVNPTSTPEIVPTPEVTDTPILPPTGEGGASTNGALILGIILIVIAGLLFFTRKK